MKRVFGIIMGFIGNVVKMCKSVKHMVKGDEELFMDIVARNTKVVECYVESMYFDAELVESDRMVEDMVLLANHVRLSILRYIPFISGDNRWKVNACLKRCTEMMDDIIRVKGDKPIYHQDSKMMAYQLKKLSNRYDIDLIDIK